MTEPEWNTASDSTPMLEFLQGRASDRKLRLFAVACCRRIWGLIPDGRSHAAVDVAERYADGLASLTELTVVLENAKVAYKEGQEAFYGMRRDIPPPHSTAPLAAAMQAAYPEAWQVNGAYRSAAYGVFSNPRSYTQAAVNSAVAPEFAAQAAVLRDIFGPLPFRPVTIDPSVLASWNDWLVVRLAQAIYDERRWGDLPVLGDALLDAGCDSDEVVAHCRAGGEHTRGCWVLDLLLGKE
jgi:hypothetical protein